MKKHQGYQKLESYEERAITFVEACFGGIFHRGRFKYFQAGGSLFQIQFSFMSQLSKFLDEPSTVANSESYAINKLCHLKKKCSKISNTIQTEASIMEWFESKGIIQGNPQEIQNLYKSSLKLKMTQKVRKMSAPCENAILLRRISKDFGTVCA